MRVLVAPRPHLARRLQHLDLAHERWVLAQRFEYPALATTYAHYRATLQARDAALEAIEADLASWYDQPPFADAVARLGAYRGDTRLGALTLASEVGDWRRFATAPQFMGFCGLVPSEYSSGWSAHRGRITKCGNSYLRAQLIESAWAYQYRAAAPLELRRRQQGLPPESHCSRVEGAAAVVRPVPSPGRPQAHPTGGSHRRCPRAGGVPVGRDDRLACPSSTSDHPTGRPEGDRGRHDAPAPAAAGRHGHPACPWCPTGVVPYGMGL
jgi:hypothetical protein